MGPWACYSIRPILSDGNGTVYGIWVQEVEDPRVVVIGSGAGSLTSLSELFQHGPGPDRYLLTAPGIGAEVLSKSLGKASSSLIYVDEKGLDWRQVADGSILWTSAGQCLQFGIAGSELRVFAEDLKGQLPLDGQLTAAVDGFGDRVVTLILELERDDGLMGTGLVCEAQGTVILPQHTGCPICQAGFWDLWCPPKDMLEQVQRLNRMSKTSVEQSNRNVLSATLHSLAQMNGGGFATVNDELVVTHVFGDFLSLLGPMEGRFSNKLLQMAPAQLSGALADAIRRTRQTKNTSVNSVLTKEISLSLMVTPVAGYGLLVGLRPLGTMSPWSPAPEPRISPEALTTTSYPWLQALPSGVVVLDKYGCIQFFNQASQRSIPIRAADIGRPLVELTIPKALRSLVQEAREGTLGRSAMRTAEHTRVDVQVSAKDDHILLLFVEGDDHLRRLEHIEEVFDQVPIMFHLLDPQLRTVYINRVGRTYTEALEHNLSDAQPQRQLNEVQLQAALGGEASRVRNQKVPQGGHMDFLFVPIVDPQDNDQVNGVLVAAIAVKDDASKEQLELVQNADRFALIAQYLRGSGLEFDGEHQPLDLSHWRTFTGLLEDDHWLAAIHEDHREEVESCLLLTEQESLPEPLNVKIRTAPKGDHIAADLHFYTPTATSPTSPVIGIYVVSSETRRSLEQLERSNADLEQFAYVASHDLRQPLRMIHQFAHILMDEESELTSSGRSHLQFLMDAAERADRLVSGLLEYSRLQNALEPEPVDLASIIASVATEAGLSLTVPAFPAMHGYPSQLEQLFGNLFRNAKTYGGEHVVVDVQLLHIGRQSITIAVDDDGPGIPAFARDRIFQLFQRLAVGGDGLGLGLSIVRRVAEGHGGRVSVEESPLGGARFVVVLKRTVERALGSPS